jgi:hypothetical protein
MSITFSIDSDIKHVLNAVSATKADGPKIRKKLLGIAASGGRSAVRKSTYSNLKRGSRALYKGYYYRVKNPDEAYIVNRAVHASTQIFGNVINVKSAKYLTFQIDGEWKKVKRVHVSGRLKFFEEIDRYLGSNLMVKKLEEKLVKELIRIWG